MKHNLLTKALTAGIALAALTACNGKSSNSNAATPVVTIQPDFAVHAENQLLIAGNWVTPCAEAVNSGYDRQKRDPKYYVISTYSFSANSRVDITARFFQDRRCTQVIQQSEAATGAYAVSDTMNGSEHMLDMNLVANNQPVKNYYTRIKIRGDKMQLAKFSEQSQRRPRDFQSVKNLTRQY